MAYNSVNSQTKRGDPTLTAWGDKLKPGMKSIAVSHDLIKMGLGHNTKVKIEGLAGVYVVKDKMNKRWKKKIDIYMGQDVKAARKWGRRKVTITFTP
ncbi:3D domain-containing protein [Sinomicrobium weinanense]|nr:3D domain-containing protein [Sinomicrobium weinanense]MBU3123780.1 3D domain-containing protein [Sinomicrobium weinanense]